MKILFICGSLEPGKDGVGDYTRRIGAALISKGYQISIIALYDRFVSSSIETKQLSDNQEITVLRLPLSLPNKQRFNLAKEYINKKDPEWLSLQFVIFSFHPKGLPLKLSNNLLNLGQGRLWHIMFHELWVGMPVHATRKHVYWGKIQALLIKTLIKKLNPSVIHTQSLLYIAQLKKLGFQAQRLPLFSNIPVISKQSKPHTVADSSMIIFVLFGTIHPDNCVEEFINELLLFEKKTNKQTIVQLLGKNGKEKENWLKLFKTAGLRLDVLGEQPSEVISEVLGNASVGISTSAMVMIEKSGTVAAMLEHGLPVICIAKPWVPRGLSIAVHVNGVYPFTLGCIEQCLAHSQLNNADISIEKVSTSFADALQCALYEKKAHTLN